MEIDSIPLFSMLKDKMGYLNQRQQVIAQNVANADTPGFTPQDLKPFVAAGPMQVGATIALAPVAQTQAGHMSGLTTLASASTSQTFKAVASPDGETRLDGNQVVLEEQMMKLNDTASDYQTAVGIYEKALSFLTTAAKEPGK